MLELCPIDYPIGHSRYTVHPLPPYSHVPGLYRHPSEEHVSVDAQYHAVEAIQREGSRQVLENWQACPRYLLGCDLYNHAFWWEAHEAWEAVWKVDSGLPAKQQFLQALIQVSAAHLKRHVGSLGGAKKLVERALRRLESVEASKQHDDNPAFMGLDLPGFIDGVRRYYASELSGSALQPHVPEQYPYIQLK